MTRNATDSSNDSTNDSSNDSSKSMTVVGRESSPPTRASELALLSPGVPLGLGRALEKPLDSQPRTPL